MRDQRVSVHRCLLCCHTLHPTLCTPPPPPHHYHIHIQILLLLLHHHHHLIIILHHHRRHAPAYTTTNGHAAQQTDGSDICKTFLLTAPRCLPLLQLCRTTWSSPRVGGLTTALLSPSERVSVPSLASLVPWWGSAFDSATDGGQLRWRGAG
jgi:hypothetical protein